MLLLATLSRSVGEIFFSWPWLFLSTYHGRVRDKLSAQDPLKTA